MYGKNWVAKKTETKSWYPSHYGFCHILKYHLLLEKSQIFPLWVTIISFAAVLSPGAKHDKRQD